MQFLHPSGPSPSFSFPTQQDELIISRLQILMKVSANTLTGRVYNISHEDALSLEATLVKCIAALRTVIVVIL